jgi:hypothetical protein
LFQGRGGARISAFTAQAKDPAMQVVERMPSTTTPGTPCGRPPGCPQIPLPHPNEALSSQQRWEKSLHDRFNDPDMLSIPQIAAMTQLSEKHVLELVETGRAISLVDEHGEHRLPYWQFFDPLWTQLPQIRAAVLHQSSSYLLDFLEQSSDSFCGMTPRMALERGHLSRVLSYAAWCEM